jgi:hypothetical protein
MDDNNVCQMKLNIFAWQINGRAVSSCGPVLRPAVTGSMTGHMAVPVGM